MKKRVLSLLLAVVMVWSLLPTAVLAAGGELAGDGRADSPYQIAGAADLMAFAEMVNGGKSGICAVMEGEHRSHRRGLGAHRSERCILQRYL